MKKTAQKSKGIQGCKKISTYFKVQSTNKTTIQKSTETKTVIIYDSDDDFLNSSIQPKKVQVKRKFDGHKSNCSPPLKKTSSNEEKLDLLSDVDNILPSTSGNSPSKCISVRNVEELLSPSALKAYNSSEKRVQKAPDKNSQDDKLTPKKQCNNGFTTPNKTAPKNSGEKNNKTPKKLFAKSPTNLKEFNVDILKNFIKVTPRKSKETSGSDTKRLSEVQSENETTPKKTIPSCSFSPTERVRAQLDFSSCTVSATKSEVSFSECDEKENFDLGNIDFDDSWADEFSVENGYTLDLSDCQRCRIININRTSSDVVLTVQSTKTEEQGICRLQGFWMDTKLNVEDTVHITAKKVNNKEWHVDNNNGYIIFEPDFLMSATRIANSVFCKRKSYFSEKFSGFDPTNKSMIVGSLTHALLQDVFAQNIEGIECIQKHAEELLYKSNTIMDIYASGEPLKAIKEEFYVYIPKISDFVSKYTGKSGKSTQPSKAGEWKGVISSVEDIEENIWCPSLGIKGKVDITIKNGQEVLPVEVKSGRATVSVEHRGQVLLYIMMMNKLGYKISSGLLLYLKEGILKEIPPTPAEQTGLMMLRNDLVYYLTKQPKIRDTSAGRVVECGEIPEPRDNRFCSTCPYSTVCVTHSRHFKEDISSLKNLGMIDAQLKDVITSAHVEYFMHWSSLLTIELSNNKDNKNLKDIYTLPPIERKKKGKCLINLQLDNVTTEDCRLFVHTFKEASDENGSFLTCGFSESNYIVLSSEFRPAVASGFITAITSKSISVTLERDLRVKYKNQRFFLDSYDSMSLLTSNMASLALILDTTDQADRLRHIIVDRPPAKFRSKIPKAVALKGKPILRRLNKVQQRAVLKAIAAEDYFLIKGMPGTGKTSTVVALIELLVELGKTVLVTSHTHSAVDNVCVKLVDRGVKLIRLGNKARIDKKLWSCAEDSFIKDCSTPDQLEAAYNSVQVIGVTCLGAGHSVLTRRTFDVCIVDESTQVIQCSVFRPIFSSKAFILVGDSDQLPAVVQNREALELGMDESLFERLDNEESRIDLNLNYRMNESITALANALTYSGKLQIATEDVAKATLILPDIKVIKETYGKIPWVLRSLDISLENAVQLLDTGPVWNIKNVASWTTSNNREQEKCSNIYEAAVVFHLVEALIKGGVLPDQIGVIATYRAQVMELNKILAHKNVEINTVDQYQGKDKSVVICSCSKSLDANRKWINNKFDLLESKRRLNVAITRAKHKLIIVGDWITLRNYSTFKTISSNLERNALKLYQCDSFDWNTVLNLEMKND